MGRRRRRNRSRLVANKRKRLAGALASVSEATGSMVMVPKNHDPLKCTDNEVEIKEEDLEADVLITDGDEYITDCPIINKIKLQENNESLPIGYEMYVIQGVNNTSEQFIVKPASPNGVKPNVNTKKKTEIKTVKTQNSNNLKAANTNISLNSDNSSSALAKDYKKQNLTPQNTLNSIKPSTTSSLKINNFQGHCIQNLVEKLGTSPAMDWYKRKFLSQNETFNSSKSSSTITTDSSHNSDSVRHTKPLPVVNYQHDDIAKKRECISQQKTCSKIIKTTDDSNDNFIHDPVENSKPQPAVNYQNGDLGNKRKSFLHETILNNSEPIITTTTSSGHLDHNGKQDPLEQTGSSPSENLKRVDLIPKQVFDSSKFIKTTTINSDSFHDYWYYDDLEQQNSLATTTYGDLNENSQDSEIRQNATDEGDTSTANTIDSMKTKKQAAEKERRAIITRLFYELKSLLPVDTTEGTKKIAINAKRRYLCPRKLLMRTCDYIRYMQGSQELLRQCIKENENLRLNNQCMQKVLYSLQSKLQSSNQELGAIVNTENNKKDT